MYPEDKDIKGVWKKYQLAAIILPTLIIWTLFFIQRHIINHENIIAFLIVLGLNFDIVGVVIASIEAPFLGFFADGGLLEGKRNLKKEVSFKRGLLLICLGFFLHGIAVIYS